MKRKTFISKLRRFAEGEGIFINQFIDKFEEHLQTTKIKKGSKKRFNKESYNEYLHSELWYSIRQRVFDKKGKKCEGCGSDWNIQVHHTKYTTPVIDGRSLNGLRVVCETCHKKIHKLVDSGYTLKKATHEVISVSKKTNKKPTHSLRKVRSSGLPETLHHSIMSVRNNNRELSPEEVLEKYESRKHKDLFIYEIYLNKKDQVLNHLKSL